jgi:hypothetical protein
VADKTVAVRLAVQDAQRAIAALKSFGAEGEAAMERIATSAPRASAAIGGLASRGQVFQQLGYQVGDFATQVASGQNALVAFTQQGAQVAGVFGPAGAVVGAIIGVAGALTATLLPALFKTGDGADELAGKFDLATDALRRLKEESKLAEAAATKVLAQQIETATPKFTGGKLQEPTIDDLTGPLARIRDREAILREAIERSRLGSGDFRADAREAAGGAAVAERNRRKQEREDAEKAAREQEQRDRQASQKKVADAKQAADALRTLEQQRFDESAENIRREVEDFEKAQADKLKAAEAFNKAAASIQEKYEQNLKAAQKEILDTQKRDQEAAAAAQADILAQPYRDLAGEISATVSDGIKQGLTDADNFDFRSVADSFGDALATAISGTLGNAITAPLNQAVTEISQRLASEFVSATGSGAPATGAGAAPSGPIVSSAAGAGTLGAAGGYAVGSIYAQATGKEDTYASTGGAIGGGIGAAAGFAVGGPAGALIGGALGSIAGSAIGGLFGGEGLGNDRSSQAYRSGKGIIYSDQSFSEGNRSITGGILAEVAALEEGLADLGGVIGTVKLRVEAGNKSGITVNGKKYATAEDALRASLEALIGGTSGLSATQQTVLANTKGKSAAEIGQDLAFGEQYDRLVFQGREVDGVLRDLNTTFQQAAREAAKLGLDVTALAAAHQREADAVVVEFQARQRGLSLSLAANAPGNSLNVALQQLELTMQDLARQAVELSVPLEQVTAAHQREAEALVVQFQAQQRSFYGTLASVRGDNSLGTQLFVLETQMQELARQAANLNIPLQAVTDTHVAAANRLIDADRELRSTFERQVGLLEAGALSNELAGIADRFGTLIDQAVELGYATDGLVAAQKRAEDQAIENARAQLAGNAQQLLGANRSAYQAIDQYLDPLKAATGAFGIGQGVFSGAATAQSGLGEFRELLARAQGGDVAALSSLVGTGQSTISAARTFGASGSEFQAIFREVNKGLLETQGQLEQRRLDLAQQGIDFQRETLDEIVRLRVETIRELRDQRDELARSLAVALERRVV